MDWFKATTVREMMSILMEPFVGEADRLRADMNLQNKRLVNMEGQVKGITLENAKITDKIMGFEFLKQSNDELIGQTKIIR